jgi:hypothetical protein
MTHRGLSNVGAARLLLLSVMLTSRVALADSVPQQPALGSSAASDTTQTETDTEPVEPTQLPAGHPPIEAGSTTSDDTMRSPVGSLSPSVEVKPGTLEVRVLNARNEPVPQASVTLHVHRESVSEGNTDRQLGVKTDDRGVARFEQLAADSALSYRLLLNHGSVNYGPQPFQLSAQQGMLATLRQLELVHDIRRALVANEAMVFVEPRDSVFQFDVVYRFYNVGQSIWVPDDVQVHLPSDRQAVNTPATGEDVQIEPSTHGIRFKGALTPGQHQLSFTFQVPRHNSSYASFEVGLPPNAMQARVGVAATRNTELVVDGFQDARPMASQSGQRLLVAMQAFDRNQRPPQALHLEIRGLPTLGSGRIVAAVIAGCLALLGLTYALYRHRQPAPGGPKTLQERARARLLEELAALESARIAGEVGPRTYEDTRTTLVDALIRLEPASL